MYSVNILVLILQQQLKENHPVMRVFRNSGPVFFFLNVSPVKKVQSVRIDR